MVQGIERREKCYVRVLLECDEEGREIPRVIIWEDGRRYPIDKVLDRRYLASMKVGGHGVRYSIQVLGKETFIWRDEQGWYVEKKISEGLTSLPEDL